MNGRLVFAVFVMFTTPLGLCQEHAPTVAQCVADRNLWSAQITDYNNAEADRLNKGTPNTTAVMRLTYTELNDRAMEMGTCAIVDAESAGAYNDLLDHYGEARDDRFKFFVRRHGLLRQMLAEDRAGRRVGKE